MPQHTATVDHSSSTAPQRACCVVAHPPAWAPFLLHSRQRRDWPRVPCARRPARLGSSGSRPPHSGVGAGHTDLGTLPGGGFSDAFAVDARGQIAGFRKLAPGGATDHATLWAVAPAGIRTLDLGRFPGGTFSTAFGINNR